MTFVKKQVCICVNNLYKMYRKKLSTSEFITMFKNLFIFIYLHLSFKLICLHLIIHENLYEKYN